MRLVEVHPAEPRTLRLRLDPPSSVCDRLDASAFLDEKRGPRRIREAVVVLVESACEAEPRVERERADERAGPIAARLEDRGERVERCRESEPGVVADPVFGREPAGEDVRVGRKRHDVVCVRVGEAAPADANRSIQGVTPPGWP